MALDAIAADERAKSRDVGVERTLRTRRRALSPQAVDQPVAGDDFVPIQKQERQKGPLLGASERQGPALDPDLDWAEDRELHSTSKALLQGVFHISATDQEQHRCGWRT